MVVEFFRSICLTTKWMCEKKGLESPRIIGFEVEDIESGDWSFLLFWYGFSYNRFETWSSHFATAEHLAAILNTVSQTRSVLHPLRNGFFVRNISTSFAKQLGLQALRQSEVDLPPTRICLPRISGQSDSKAKVVEWVGPSVLSAPLRS